MPMQVEGQEGSDKSVPKIYVRWMIGRDMSRALEIERQSFATPWDEGQFLEVLRRRNCIAMAVDDLSESAMAAFVVYELLNTSIHVLNLAVAPEYRRCGFGRAMIEKLQAKIYPHGKRTSVALEVRETNLDAQLFFRALGFRCVEIVKGFDGDPYADEPAYRFVWRQGK